MKVRWYMSVFKPSGKPCVGGVFVCKDGTTHHFETFFEAKTISVYFHNPLSNKLEFLGRVLKQENFCKNINQQLHLDHTKLLIEGMAEPFIFIQ